MKKIVIAILLMLFIPSINATIIKQSQLLNNHYAIKLDVFIGQQDSKKLCNRFPQEDTYMSLRKHKINSYYHIFIVNIKTKEEAYKKLKTVKNIVKGAFVVLKKTNNDASHNNIIKKDELLDMHYAIKLGKFKKSDVSKKICAKFPKEKKYISVRQYKDSIYYHSFIVNIKTKKEAYKKLQSVKKIVEEAFVVLKKVKSKEKKNNDLNETVTKKTPTTGLSLKDAILKALNKSNKIQSAKQKVIQAKYKLKEKQAGHKPRVVLYATGGGTYQNVKDNIEQTYLNGAADLSVTQNIYAGGSISNNIKKEEQNLKIAVFKFRESVEKEILSIIESYINIIYEKKGIKINRENMKDLQKILNIVTIKEQSGAASKGDLNYIKSNVENASSALVKAESKYQNAISYYEYFIGSNEAKYKPNQKNFNIKLLDQNSTIAKMSKYNAKIQIAKATVAMQKYDMRSRRSPFRPNIDLIVNAKRKATRAEGIPLEDKANAVLSINYNLYNGGKDKATLLKSKSKVAELQYKLTDVKQSTLFNTKQMYENTNSAKDSLSHTQKEVQANQKVTKSYWDAFKYGEQDIQALLLAQRALNRSQLDEIKERKDFILGLYKLLGQTGELVEKIGVSDFVNPKKIGDEIDF